MCFNHLHGKSITVNKTAPLFYRGVYNVYCIGGLGKYVGFNLEINNDLISATNKIVAARSMRT
jgi:hypothetical protein